MNISLKHKTNNSFSKVINIIYKLEHFRNFIDVISLFGMLLTYTISQHPKWVSSFNFLFVLKIGIKWNARHFYTTIFFTIAAYDLLLVL